MLQRASLPWNAFESYNIDITISEYYFKKVTEVKINSIEFDALNNTLQYYISNKKNLMTYYHLSNGNYQK